MGQFVSAIAVVISLLYLALQVKQNTIQIDHNTKVARSQGINSSISHTLQIKQAIFENKKVLRIFFKENSDPSVLSKEERLRSCLILHNCIGKICNTYAKALYSDLPVEIWESQKTLIKRLLLTKGGVWFWTHFGSEFDPLFKKDVEKLIFSDGIKIISEISLI
jgi:hypothetical protein